jgi:uncharacterized membrane protein
VMLSAFGVFWTGEGLGVAWPGHDLALLVFAALFLGAGLVASAPPASRLWRWPYDDAQGGYRRAYRDVHG